MGHIAADTGPGLREVVDQAVTTFRWRYDSESPRLRTLYEKSKRLHWNASMDLDWSIEVDPDAENVPDFQIPIYGSEIWDRLTARERVEVRREFTRWVLSQFLHGEQGALLCTAQIATAADDLDAKLYAAQQVADEARHVEAYSRYLTEKYEGIAPINDPLWGLMEDTVRDSRPDMTQLGMQVMIEGLALAAFGMMHQLSREPLLTRMIRQIMNDESRHVAFGVLYLKDRYAQLSAAELREREDFAFEAALHMRDRFVARELWERLGLPVDECVRLYMTSPIMSEYRKMLFSRIVPNLKRIGLLTPALRARLAPLDVLQFEDLPADDETHEAVEMAAHMAGQGPGSPTLAG